MPDAWILRDGKPVYDEAPGRNVAVVRSERGRDLLQRAVAAGYLEIADMTLDDLEAMHTNHPARKVGTPAAMFAMDLLRQPRPRVSGYRPWRSARHAGVRVLTKQFTGTVRRVVRGDNRESTIQVGRDREGTHVPSERGTPKDSRTSDWRATARKVSNWGQWGPDDQLGTRNLITEDVTRRAAGFVRRGAIFDLGIPLDRSGPQQGNGRINPVQLMSAINKPSADYGLSHYNDDYVFMPLQAGTQWDGLSHVLYEDRFYNDVPSSAVTFAGAQRLGIETQAKGVVGRGVLLDVARFMDLDWLQAGHVITGAHLDGVAAAQGVSLLPGDILLVRTGWRRRFLTDGDGPAFLSEEPGLGLDACEWLFEKSIGAVASDNWGIEAKRFDSAEQAYPVHMVLIRDMGMLLGEMWDFEELAADCHHDGVWEFLLTAPVLKFTGAVGSPTNPLAIK